MNCKLRLLSNDGEKVVYLYSVDGSVDIIDGQISCDKKTGECQTLVRATNDENGGFAKWLYSHVCGLVFNHGCPEEKYLATG